MFWDIGEIAAAFLIPTAEERKAEKRLTLLLEIKDWLDGTKPAGKSMLLIKPKPEVADKTAVGN
jgi:hypothetical protein